MTEQKPAEVMPAATILLVRDEPEFQVLMVKRHHQIDFASGALVFPGGKPHFEDSSEEWAAYSDGWERVDATQRMLKIAAIREAYEEAGILLAANRDGSPFEGGCDPDSRRAVEQGERSFLDVVREADVILRLDCLSEFARWITPVFMKKRFDEEPLDERYFIQAMDFFRFALHSLNLSSHNKSPFQVQIQGNSGIRLCIR